MLAYTIEDWDQYRLLAVVVGLLIGAFVILVDIFLKGFSLRGMTALTFGLSVGAFIAYLISSSPLFEHGDTDIIFISRLSLFVICSYLGAVIALRGKDEFHLVIPYVRFVPHGVDVPLVVIDTSALIDGRVVKIWESHFMSAAIVIPRFVFADLQKIADSSEPVQKARGRRGLEVLNRLRAIPDIDLRIQEVDAGKREEIDSKLIFLVTALKAKLLTTDYNLAKLAQFHGITWLNVNDLQRSLIPEIAVGEQLVVKVAKRGKEPDQGVGFLTDGSMVVINEGADYVGSEVAAEIVNVMPSGTGKIIFTRYVGH